MYASAQDLCTNRKDEEYWETEEQRRKPTLGGLWAVTLSRVVLVWRFQVQESCA